MAQETYTVNGENRYALQIIGTYACVCNFILCVFFILSKITPGIKSKVESKPVSSYSCIQLKSVI